MVVMEHPNGCIHTVRDDLVEKFRNAGWNIKGKETSPVIQAGPKKRKTRSKKQ